MSKYLFLLLSVLIIFIFCLTLVQNAQNIPSFDDYDATLSFIRNFYFEKRLLLQKTKLLFSFHNEHCIMISRASAAIYFYIFQEINFKPLVLYQNLFLFGFFAVLLAIMRQQKLISFPVVLFTIFFLFSLSFWQVSFYYWAGIQHYTVFFFSFLSLFLLNKTEKPVSRDFLLAVFSVLLAVCSFGNGLLTLFLGAFLLLVQRKYRTLIAWSIISAAILIVIFLSRNPAQIADGEKFNLEWMGRLLFTFLGSYLFVNPSVNMLYTVNIIICFAFGVAVFIFWLWLFFKGYAFKNPLLYVLFSLPILTGIIISISRFSTKAAGGIAPRYMFFTAVIPVMLVLILLDLKILNKKSQQFLVVLGSIIWMTSFYNNINALKSSNKELVTAIHVWQQDKTKPLINQGNLWDYSYRLRWAVENNVIDIDEK